MLAFLRRLAGALTGLTLASVAAAGCAVQSPLGAAAGGGLGDAGRTAEVSVLLRREYAGPVAPGARYMHVDLMPRPGEVAGFYSTAPGRAINAMWGVPGAVYAGVELGAKRPQYVDVNRAKQFSEDGREDLRIVTDWVRLRVTPGQQAALARAVERLQARPPRFHLLGHNCVSRAAMCLREAGILPTGIPGMDNGENLLRLLRRHYPDLTLERGFFGLDAQGRPFVEGF